ncbi:MAG: PRC-barrel domain-containing protein [Acidobacteriota bacterium]|nr:PRC-barrel domain-containing protein [Acidobacteriota bacterium]
MLETAGHMKDSTIHATDGEIGRVEEFYFDDEKWTIRYLIVNTGDWLSGRQVLISPIFLRQVDHGGKQLHIALTKKQIEKSPEIDTHRPVSRQDETANMDYYGSSYYWGDPYLWGPVSLP